MALTFDDGPDPLSTPQFLRVLDEQDVRATFFLLGSMLERSPRLAGHLVDSGHEVAVHGWDHRNLMLADPATTQRQLRRTQTIIRDVTGARAAWWRPPYGVLTGSGLLAARRTGLRPVLWGAWGKDWTMRASPGSVAADVLRSTRGGTTILLHDSSCTSEQDSWRSSLGALPIIIARCRAMGLRIGPLREHGLA